MYLEDAKEDYIEEYQPCKGCIYEGYTSGLCHFCLRNPDRNEFSDHDYYVRKLTDDYGTTDPEEARIEDLHVRADDPVNHPSHYTQGNIECIEAIRSMLTPEEFRGYCKGQMIKYVWREKHKGQDESIKKAIWYGEELTGGHK